VRKTALAIAAALLATGCGTTVQGVGTGTSSSGTGELAAPSGVVPTTGGGAVAGGPTGSAPGLSVPGTGTTGSDAGASAGTSSNAAAPAAPAAAAPGATNPTGPIKVGMLITKTSNASDYGVSLGNTISESDVDQALVQALNKRGGLDGRRIIPIYASTDTATTNWSTDYEAACATFTQDNHVDAVIGYSFDYERNFEACLTQKGIPHLTTAFNVPDNAELRQWPLFWALSTPTIDERSVAKLQGAIATGELTSKNKLGVVIDNCPGTQHAWKSVVEPYLRSQHIDVAATQDFGCGSGNNASTANEAASAGNALLSFRSKNVDRITFISVSEGPALLILSEAAESQHYYPTWIVSSLANLALQQGQAPADQLKNVQGYGWLETQDVSPSLYSKPNATQRRCLSLVQSQNVHPQSAADYGFVYSVCEAMFVYERALQVAHGNAAGSAIIGAVAAIGRFESVLNYDGASMFGSNIRNNAPRIYRHVLYQSGCACFQYVGRTYSMP
jgi:hypothetical protein